MRVEITKDLYYYETESRLIEESELKELQLDPEFDEEVWLYLSAGTVGKMIDEKFHGGGHMTSLEPEWFRKVPTVSKTTKEAATEDLVQDIIVAIGEILASGETKQRAQMWHLLRQNYPVTDLREAQDLIEMMGDEDAAKLYDELVRICRQPIATKQTSTYAEIEEEDYSEEDAHEDLPEDEVCSECGATDGGHFRDCHRVAALTEAEECYREELATVRNGMHDLITRLENMPISTREEELSDKIYDIVQTFDYGFTKLNKLVKEFESKRESKYNFIHKQEGSRMANDEDVHDQWWDRMDDNGRAQVLKQIGYGKEIVGKFSVQPFEKQLWDIKKRIENYYYDMVTGS